MTSVGAGRSARGAVTARSGPGGVRELVAHPLVRRFASCMFLAVVAAAITDKNGGNSQKPLHELDTALVNPRIVFWLVLGALVFGVWTFGAPLMSRARSATVGFTSVTGRPPVRYGTYVGLLALAIVGPRLMPGYLQQTAFTGVAIYALLALGLNVVVGYAGLLDLGFIAFYAIGAYATAYFTRGGTDANPIYPLPIHPPFHLNGFLVLPIAALLAALAGVILGGPTLRLRGDYLAIVTLGFGEIVQLLANNADKVTNGPQGAFGVPHLSVGGRSGYTFGLPPLPNYYLLLGIIVLVMVAFSRLEKSRTGRAWAAIREDEVAAAATGVPTLKYKLLAFAIGASTSGFAGVIFASYQFFNPMSFGFQQSILVLTIVIFGGMGNIFGSVIGAAVLQFLTSYLTHSGLIPSEDTFVFFGAIVMVMMVFRPQGLIPSRRRVREIKLSEAGVGGADALGAVPGGAVA